MNSIRLVLLSILSFCCALRAQTDPVPFISQPLGPPSLSAASAEWKEKLLHIFPGTLPDGGDPASGVVFDKAGNLYGATTDGGANDCPGIAQCGIVFQLQPPRQKGGIWHETILYVFKGKDANDGETPAGGVIFDQAGNLYGTTAYGGTGGCSLLGVTVGCGVVFQLSPPAQKGGPWTESVLYSFQSGKDGYFPSGDLTFDPAGNLYGATQNGGGYGSCNSPYYQFCGTVFRLSPPQTKGGKWTEKVLYAFKGATDGANPNGWLVLDNKGAIYGTTNFGGINPQNKCSEDAGAGCGTVFKLTPPNAKGGKWTETVLHLFNTQDGMFPTAGLVYRNGNLYGTTPYGGEPSWFGVVFELKRPSGTVHSWTETVLHLFTDRYDGAQPMGGVIFDSNGSIYGTTASPQGTRNQYQGKVFRMTEAGGSWSLTVLYTFSGMNHGARPATPLVLDQAGNIYGTTPIGGNTGTDCGPYGCGTVFELSP